MTAPGARDPSNAPLVAAAAVDASSGLARTLGRHQIGSLVATLVDFGTMTALVELGVLTPTFATAVGASAGGVSNFLLGRTWIFRADDEALGGQALRYAVVSAASAVLNSIGEHLVHDRLGVQYVLARALVAVVVSIAWNFPLQKKFVFKASTP